MMQSKMKAQVFYEPNTMKMEDIDIPVINDSEILVKVKACGICGSDIAYYYGRSPVETTSGKGPIILGHELSGEVVQVGNRAADLNLVKPGDKVIVNPAQQCNACPSCSKGYINLCEHPTVLGVSVNGGFAEYVKSSYTHVYKMPENLSFEEGAMVEPLACAIYGVDNLNVELGDFVVVIGPGAIGLMMISIIKAKGAGRVALVGTRDYRLRKGKEMGADYVMNVVKEDSPYYIDDIRQEISDLTGGELAHRVIVPTSAIPAMHQAIEISGKRSTIVYFGLPGPKDVLEIPALSTLTQDKTIRFSWLAPWKWPLAIKAVETGKVILKNLITNRFSLDKVEEGIIFIGSPLEEKIKAMVII